MITIKTKTMSDYGIQTKTMMSDHVINTKNKTRTIRDYMGNTKNKTTTMSDYMGGMIGDWVQLVPSRALSTRSVPVCLTTQTIMHHKK